MAQSVADEPIVGRCPVCLCRLRLPPELKPEQRVKCKKCDAMFIKSDVLPFRKPETSEQDSIASEIKAAPKHRPLVWLAVIMALFAAGVLITWFSPS